MAVPPQRELLPKEMSDPIINPSTKRKRSTITKCACYLCRAKKQACDGIRPQCGRCAARNLRCAYATQTKSETLVMALKRENKALKQSLNRAESFLLWLAQEDEHTTHEDLTMARGNPSTEMVSAQIDLLPNSLTLENEFDQHSTLPLGPFDTSPYNPKCAHIPSPYPSYSKAYPLQEPDELVALTQLLKSKDHVISSIASKIYEGKTSPTPLSGRNNPKTHVSINSMTDKQPQERHPRFKEGFPRAPPGSSWYASASQILAWTAVPATVDIILGAITTYLDIDHPILGLFDARIFLDDFFTGQEDFCTKFLVNALLAFACQAHASTVSIAASISYDFEKEAKTLMAVEPYRNLICRIPALILLSLSLSMHGEGLSGKDCLKQAFDLAQELKLFGVSRAIRFEDLCGCSDREVKFRSQVAWATFNITNMHGFFHAAEYIAIPPSLPIPMAQYHAPDMTVVDLYTYTFPTGATAVFSQFCMLWSLVSSYLAAHRQTNSSSNIPTSAPLQKYNELIEFLEKLQIDEIPGTNHGVAVLLFYMWYHAIILDILRPFVIAKNQNNGLPNSDADITPAMAFAASVQQLKRLILVYLAKQPFISTCFWWHVSLMYVANAVVKDTNESSWRAYFLLCLRGYQSLLSCFQVAASIIKGLLVIGVDVHAISAQEACMLFRYCQRITSKMQPTTNEEGAFVVDLDRAVTNPAAANVNTLIDRFEDIRVSEEFLEFEESSDK